MATETPIAETRLVYVIDDDPEVARSVTSTLSAVGYEVQSYATAEEFLSQAAVVAPSVAIIDILLPGMTGLTLCHEIAERRLPCAFAVISGHADVRSAVEAMRLGAVDVLEKPFSRQRLADVVNQAIQVSRINHVHQIEEGEIVQRMVGLSPREQAVLAAMAEGLVTKEIASRLSIRPRTVDVYRSRMMQKLRLESPSQLAKVLAVAESQARRAAVEARADAALRASEERYRKLFEVCPDGIGLLDFSGRLLDVNHSGAHMHGYSREELLAMTVHDLAVPEDTDVEKRLARLQAGESLHFEAVHRRRDGTRFTLQIVATPAQSSGESYFLAFGQDITERHHSDEQLALLRKQLTHAARLGTLGEMAAGLAHELNQPLASLQLYAAASHDLLTAGNWSGLRQCLTYIDQQAHRASEIIRRVRAFAGRGPFRREPADVNELVNEVLAILENERRLARVRTTIILDDKIPMIDVDRIQIQQVLVNLIRNACEAMSLPDHADRGLAIATSMDAGNVRVSVADTGAGVDPAAAVRLFKPFESTKSEGLGLGLAICRTIVESHGGSIGFEPNQPRGAIFFFLLPIQPVYEP